MMTSAVSGISERPAIRPSRETTCLMKGCLLCGGVRSGARRARRGVERIEVRRHERPPTRNHTGCAHDTAARPRCQWRISRDRTPANLTTYLPTAARRLPFACYHVGGLLSDHDGRGVGVAAGYRG